MMMPSSNFMVIMHHFISWYSYNVIQFNMNFSFSTAMNKEGNINHSLTLKVKHRETHGCVVSTVATDALVLKHQAINIHNAD